MSTVPRKHDDFSSLYDQGFYNRIGAFDHIAKTAGRLGLEVNYSNIALLMDFNSAEAAHYLGQEAHKANVRIHGGETKQALSSEIRQHVAKTPKAAPSPDSHPFIKADGMSSPWLEQPKDDSSQTRQFDKQLENLLKKKLRRVAKPSAPSKGGFKPKQDYNNRYAPAKPRPAGM